jgi:rod shape-determining protein MreD
MRSAAYMLVGFLLVLVQANLYRVLGPASELTLFGVHVGRWLHGATPNLVLPFIVYLGIHEHSMARGALLAYGMGWALDVLGPAPMFLFRFTAVALWWLARIASVRLSAQTFMTRVPLAFAFSLFESLIVLTLLAIFGADNRRPLEIASIVLPRAVGTSLCAPFLFALAHRLQVEGRAPAGSAQTAAGAPGASP